MRGTDHSLTLFDRAYFSAAVLLARQGAGEQRHWLMRAKDKLRYQVLQTHGAGDWLIEMPVSAQARQQQATLPARWQARLIEVRVAGRPRRFLTSLLDAARYPAEQLAHSYVQRWEIELVSREIKQSLQAGEFVLCGKQAALVRQERWGVLLAYSLLRIGFHVAAIAITDVLRFAPLESAGTLPRWLALLFEQAKLFILPPRREGRAFPRVVKAWARKYPRKNASQR